MQNTNSLGEEEPEAMDDEENEDLVDHCDDAPNVVRGFHDTTSLKHYLFDEDEAEADDVEALDGLIEYDTDFDCKQS